MKIIKRPSEYTPTRSLIDEFFNYSPLSVWDDMHRGFEDLYADVWEEGNNIFVRMALPGIKKEDINISVTGDTLSIEGRTKEEKKEEDDKKKYYFQSLRTRSYSQQFNLPTFVNADKVDAKYEDGVLTVKLPKAKESETKQIEVK
jgi:HSP20 family protein